ncbi:MAG: glycosyltransferase [Bacilli bacterium]|nr:glycosyltransferase [Bacilli bacterium]
MKKLTILCLHMGYGGAENAIASLANNLCNKYDIEIVSVYKLYDKEAYTLDKKINVTYLMETDIALRTDTYKKLLRSHKIFKLFKVLLRDYKINIFRLAKDTIDSYINVKNKKRLMINYIKNMNTDIVLSTRLEYNYYLSEYQPKAYKVAWEHNHGDIKYIREVIKSCNGVDRLVVVSKGLYDIYTSETNDLKISYIPNVLDELPDKKSKLDNKSLVSVGRLVTVKGYNDMIDVMKIINEKDPSITLEIIGDGDLKYDLKNKVKDLKLDKNIKLVGLKDKKYINDKLAKSSLFISTSHSESFGLAVIEAMSAGVPVIAFDSAEGLTELIDNKNGILIQNRNIEEMANEIIELLDDKVRIKEMGKNAYNTSLNYTKDKVYDKWLKVMEDK